MNKKKKGGFFFLNTFRLCLLPFLNIYFKLALNSCPRPAWCRFRAVVEPLDCAPNKNSKLSSLISYGIDIGHWNRCFLFAWQNKMPFSDLKSNEMALEHKQL